MNIFHLVDTMNSFVQLYSNRAYIDGENTLCMIFGFLLYSEGWVDKQVCCQLATQELPILSVIFLSCHLYIVYMILYR